MEFYHIGMDVHSSETVFVGGTESREVLVKGTVDTQKDGLKQMLNRLSSKIKLKEYSMIGTMESGSSSFRVAKILQSLGVDAMIFHANEVRKKANNKTTKTDRRDAMELFKGSTRGYYEQLVYIPTDAEWMIRMLGATRANILKTKVRATNSAKSMLRTLGLTDFAKMDLSSSKNWEKLIDGLNGMDESQWQEILGWPCQVDFRNFTIEIVSMHSKMWLTAQKNIEECEQMIRKAVLELDEEQQQGVARIDDMFGVGFISAAVLVSIIGNPQRFHNSGQVKKYFGLATKEISSGDSDVHGKITKEGNRVGRTILVELAQQASRSSHAFHPYLIRLTLRRNRNKAIVAVAGKMIQVIWRMLRDGTAFDAEKLHVVMVRVPKLTKKGKMSSKIVAVAQNRLKDFLAEHNLGEDAIIESHSEETRKDTMKDDENSRTII